MLFSTILITSLLASANAVNDWSVPCFKGSCEWSIPSGSGAASSGSMKIWGSPDAITDITPAAGWVILGCSPDKTSQDIRLVCQSDDPNAGCSNLYKNIGAVGKIVRLPNDCGANPFARIANAWDSEDQTIPASISKRLVRRAGVPPKVRALKLDTNFAGIDIGKAGAVNIAIMGANVPGVPDGLDLPNINSRMVHPRLFGFVKDAVKKVGNAASSAVSAVSSTAKKVTSAVTSAPSRVINTAKTAVKTAAKKVTSTVKTAAKKVANTAKKAVKKVASTAKTAAKNVDKAADKAVDTAKKVVAKVDDAADDVVDKAKAGVKKAASKVEDVAEDVVEKVKEGAGKVADKAGDVIDDVKEGAGKVLGAAGDFVDKAADKVGDIAENVAEAGGKVLNAVAGGVDVDENVKLPPINVNKQFNLVDQSFPCGPVEGKVKVDVNAKATALVAFGVAATGTLVPPVLSDFSIDATLSADIDSTVTIDASVSGGIDSGKIPIFEVGIPGLNFPGILNIGPSFTVDAQALAELELGVKMDIGIKYAIDQAKIVFPPTGEKGGSFKIKDTPLNLALSPSVRATGTVEAHLIPSLNLGISALGDVVEANVFVNLDASASATLNLESKLPTISGSIGRREIEARQNDATFGGCFNIKAGLSVNAGADASFFSIFDKGTSVALFEREFKLFEKCFGDRPTKRELMAFRYGSLRQRRAMVQRIVERQAQRQGGLRCPAGNATEPVSVANQNVPARN